MKIKTTGIILVWLASMGFACASTNDIVTLVQKGLFEEEANHHLDAAIENYQQAIDTFDKDRRLTATAIFHLGECYRQQGKTNEANVQYQRIVREFSDQAQLVELSRRYLPKGGATVSTGVSSFTQNLTRITEGAGATISDEEAAEARKIKDMIQNSPDLVNSPGRLATAAGKGWLTVVKLLVDNGATVNPEMPVSVTQDLWTTAWTPLTAAANSGNKGMIEFLISKGANLNALDCMSGFAPLHYAAKNGFKAVAETLLADGADVDCRARDGATPLYVAAAKDYAVMVEFLLAHKADINAPKNNGETPLFTAVQNNHLDMVHFLLAHKADVNHKSESGRTPLLVAMGGDTGTPVFKALLDGGADVEATVNGHRPLDVAVDEGRIDRVELLLQKNADPNIRAKLTVMGRHGDSDMQQERLVAPLILAISRDNANESKIITLLLDHAANPNLADETGETPLDYAIRRSNTNLVAALIQHHADVNAMDKNGDPPLAYVWGDIHVTTQIKRMLVEAGANEDYERRDAIFVTQKGTGSIGNKVFVKGTNSINRYTLFELMADVYGTMHHDHDRPANNNPRGFGFTASGIAYAVGFPDLAHLTINRLQADGSKVEMVVNLGEILKSGDCSKDLALDWGDIVLIPQRDHMVDSQWKGLSDSEREALGKCLTRQVKIVVKGQTTPIALLPAIVVNAVYPSIPGWVVTVPGNGAVSPALAETLKDETVLYTFDLNEVVHKANVLLISSDLSRVKLYRDASKAAGPLPVMELNLESDPPPVIQLMDGDTIAIPERPN